MPHWKMDASRLYNAVEAIRRFGQMTAKDIATMAGIPASTLTRLKAGSQPDVDAFASLVMALRLDPTSCFVRSDGLPVEEEDAIPVNRRDVLIACSWAREALIGLPAHLQPREGNREVILAAIARLVEEIGLGPEAEVGAALPGYSAEASLDTPSLGGRSA